MINAYAKNIYNLLYTKMTMRLFSNAIHTNVTFIVESTESDLVGGH